MTIGRYFLLGLGGLAAASTWVTSFAIVNQSRKPAATMAVGVPPQGAAEARLARELYTARLGKNPKAEPSKFERRLAGKAFATEPLLAANALPVLVAGLAADGKTQSSEQLLQLAGRVTRRDRLINAMLIDNELPKKRPERAMQLFERAMAVNLEVRSFYLERLAGVTGTPGALRALVPMLGRAPDWSAEYWAAVVQNPRITSEAGELRLRIARSPWNQHKPFDTDPQLIRALVQAEQFDMASALARALGIETTAGDSLVDPGFSNLPSFPPIDWELLQSGEIGVSIDRAKGVLLLSSLPASSGIAARQLTALSPGRYRLLWDTSGLKSAPGADLRFRLACTDSNLSGGKSIDSGQLTDGAGSKIVDVSESKCRWYWLTIELNTTDESGADIALDRISLRREVANGSKRLPPSTKN